MFLLKTEVFAMSLEKLPHDHGDNGINLLESMPSETAIENVSNIMRQLADPSRLRIFWLLCHKEECVTNIAALTQMSSPAVSHHLRLLKSCGLITSKRSGKEMYYRSADTEMVALLHRNIEKIADINCPN